MYNLDEDFSQADDVADKYPDKVRELTELFWAEAERNQALPLFGEIAFAWGFPKHSTDQTKFTYYNGTENISAAMIPPIYNRSYSISADLDNPGRSCLEYGLESPASSSQRAVFLADFRFMSKKAD